MVVCGALLALAGPLAAQDDEQPDPNPAIPNLALMGTIPIYWGEAASFGELLDNQAQAHWARSLIERAYHIAPVDFLTADVLAEYRFLMMAQPRALAATENVALDQWVRGGGRLLLFADPMMTGESRFPIGDRRRPQDVALLSPILSHWGLELQFDEAQAAGIQMPELSGQQFPVNLPGQLVTLDEAGECTARGDGLIALCELGLGEVVIVADAAILDFAGPYLHAELALATLMEHIFLKNGDFAGDAVPVGVLYAENPAFPPVIGGATEPVGRASPP